MNFFKTLYKNKFLRVVVLLIILLLPFTLDYRFVVVDGDSMYPTYDHGEIIIQERIRKAYGHLLSLSIIKVILGIANQIPINER